MGKLGKNMENMVKMGWNQLAENSEDVGKMSARKKRSASKGTVREFVRVRQRGGFLNLGRSLIIN